VVALGDVADVALATSVFTDTDAVVVAAVVTPRLVGRRRVEPMMRALAVVTSPAVATAVGGVPLRAEVGFHRRIADAGYRIRLIPRVTPSVDPQRHDGIDRPVVVILAAVPTYDVGGGSRGAQLATELLRRGFHVVYVALFGSHESVDLGLRFIHPHLEQYRADEFDAAALAKRCAPGHVLVEIPAPAYLPGMHLMRAARWSVVYDVIDLWSDPALGGDWYRDEVEADYLRSADLVVASAPDLVVRAARTRPEALLIPNGVNAAVFGGAPGPVPSDLPAGDGAIFGYHGSLYGDWFDWEGVIELAQSHPESRVVLIGDPPVAVPPLPANVHLLGLKPQAALRDYLPHFDIGLLPFVVSATTHAVSPLKVFEYLAVGVPVAAAPLRSLTGIEGVAVADRLVDAVERAREIPRPDRAAALRSHSWENRVGMLLAALEGPAPAPDRAPEVVIRPVTHYHRDERRL
jgi:glycosyltransferase involved in cell wall biosynthesis